MIQQYHDQTQSLKIEDLVKKDEPSEKKFIDTLLNLENFKRGVDQKVPLQDTIQMAVLKAERESSSKKLEI